MKKLIAGAVLLTGIAFGGCGELDKLLNEPLREPSNPFRKKVDTGLVTRVYDERTRKEMLAKIDGDMKAHAYENAEGYLESYFKHYGIDGEMKKRAISLGKILMNMEYDRTRFVYYNHKIRTWGVDFAGEIRKENLEIARLNEEYEKRRYAWKTRTTTQPETRISRVTTQPATRIPKATSQPAKRTLYVILVPTKDGKSATQPEK